MKRCPQCEFIYEDDQSLCDMDGVLLVLDSRNLPNLHALATVSGPLPEKGPRRSRMVPAFATLILMLAVGSVYYVSTIRTATPPDFSPATVNATAPVPEMPAVIPPAPTPAAEESPAAEQPAKPRETHSSPAPVAKPAAEPARKATTTNSAPAKPDPKKKDDSKVESILKKTGKLLKKPFKF